jgi:hypothetical protein
VLAYPPSDVSFNAGIFITFFMTVFYVMLVYVIMFIFSW